MTKRLNTITAFALFVTTWHGAVRASDPLLETLPNDALAAFQFNRPQQLLPREGLTSLCELALGDRLAGKKLAEAVIKMPGEIVIGVLPAPDKKVKFHLILAADVKGSAIDCDDLVRKGVMPALARLSRTDEQQFDLDTSASIHRIIKKNSGDTVFAYATKNEIFFGCTRPQFVQDWMHGDWPAKPWVREPGLRRALTKASKNYAVRVLINPASIGLPSADDKPEPNSWQDLAHKFLPPEEIESIIGEIEWERTTISAHVKIALGETSDGLSRVVSRPATSSTQIGAFPDDYTLVGRIGMTSLQGFVDGIHAITDRIDPTISHEYREDLEGFKKDTGCDWDNGLLGNISGEIAFGTRVDFTKNPPIAWAVIAPLADESKFNSALEKLIAHFKLPLEDKKHGDMTIRESGPRVPFAMVTHEKRLIIADGPDTIKDLAKNHGGSRVASPPMRELLASLGESNQFAMCANLDQILTKTPLGMMAPEKFKKLIAGQLGVNLTCLDRIARLDLRWNMKSKRPAKEGDESQPPEDSIVTVLETGLSSIQDLRTQSQRTVSSANMRGIGMGFYIWAQDHKGSFPPDLKTLIESNNVTPMMFASPYEGQFLDENSNVDTDGYLVYRPGLSTSSAPSEILLAEKPRDGMDGANFLFVDSHVEFIPEPKASELLKLMAENAPEIRYQSDGADR